MRVVFTAKQVGGRKTQLSKARAIRAAAHDVVIRFKSGGHEGFASQLNRAHVFT